MRSHLLLAVAGGTLAVIATLATGLSLLSGPADPPGPEPTPATHAASAIPLTHVHLFSSGVGYFQREGVIDGNARIDLTFPVENVNDLIKSLVLRDLDGGRISVVGYDSHDPIDKTLRGFAINLADNPSYAQILHRARGEKVEIALTSGGQSATLTGTIMGVEKQKHAAGTGNAIVEVDVLNLWCADGLRGVKLAEVQRLRFLNPAVESEIKQALELLSRGADNRKKTVSLNFVGEGKRRVRIGYVLEHPLWKTTYRLSLDRDGKPTLQGWAVIDNPTDEEWKNVRLALVSGRPLSFQMDLYTPLYVPRPKVELDLFAGLKPPMHAGAMGWMDVQREALDKRVTGKEPEPGAPPRPPVTAEAVGDFFQYVVEHPVSLPRQKSALFPILDKPVEGKAVGVYSPGNGIKHPLFGLRFKNSTGLHLNQGPVAVFADGTYAGDARLPHVQPGEEHLLTWAIDLGGEVETQVGRPGETLVSVRVDKGVLVATTKVREGKTYVLRNRSPRDRVVLVEHPFRPEFSLVGPASFLERTAEAYRFEITVPAGKTVNFDVVEERLVDQKVVLTDADDQTVLRYLSGTAITADVKAALEKARDLKAKLHATLREKARTERQLKVIVDDQARLRANLERVPAGTEAYQRYLKKFDEQEVEIEKLQDAIKRLVTAEFEQRQAYDDFLANLSVG